jgi:fatty acid-binding protein DegV
LKEPDSFKTAPFNPEACLTAFREASKYANNILFITVSVKISTGYNVAKIAKEKASIELPKTRIEILDSETATSAQGFVVLAASRAAESGQNFEEVVDAANKMKEKVHALVILDTVNLYFVLPSTQRALKQHPIN